MITEADLLAEKDRILRRKMAQAPKGDDLSLADLFVATTHSYARNIKQGAARKAVEDIMMQYRIDMRHAHRFVLDDEFVELATEASHVQAEKTLARLQYAQLPYETTWIEFNLHAKVRKIRELHQRNDLTDYSEISPRLGILLRRIDATTALLQMVHEGPGNTAEVHLLSYYFSTVGRTNWPKIFGVQPAPRANNTEIDAVTWDTMWGYTDFEERSGDVPVASLRTPTLLADHGSLGIGRMFEIYRNGWNGLQLDKKRLAGLMSIEATEFTGHARWLVTVLAMLNEVPVHAEHVVSSRQQRVGLLKRAPVLDYHKLTLRLPKSKPLPWIERHLRGGSERRHKAHEVRQHWRTYLHETYCKPEEHAWEYDHENGYRLCGKCEAYGRLIHEHVRGDPELGWVRKDYIIKKEKAA